MTVRKLEKLLEDLPMYGVETEADLEACGCDVCRSLLEQLARERAA